MYVFDTDTISNVLKKEPSKRLLRKLDKTPSHLQFTTSITISELYYGAYKSQHTAQLLKIFEEKVIPTLQVLDFNGKAAMIYGKIRAGLEKRGFSLSEPDLRIGAITIANEMILITGNVRHFQKIPRLKIENWLT